MKPFPTKAQVRRLLLEMSGNPTDTTCDAVISLFARREAALDVARATAKARVIGGEELHRCIVAAGLAEERPFHQLSTEERQAYASATMAFFEAIER